MLVLGAALVAPLVDRALRGEEEAQRALDLTLVETWDITDRAHTTDDVTYPQDPPAGGAHAPIWLACGVYDEPVRDENAVHDLEHGTVWITHDPDLSADDVERSPTSCPTTGSCRRATACPHLWSSPCGVPSSSSTAPTTRRLGLFIEEYGDGHTAPEFGVSCQGGTPDPQATCRARAPTPDAGSSRSAPRNSSRTRLNSSAWLTLKPCGAPATTMQLGAGDRLVRALARALERHGARRCRRG